MTDIKETKLSVLLYYLKSKKWWILGLGTLLFLSSFCIYYILGQRTKTEIPYYCATLEAYYDYDFEAASIMNYASILCEEETVKDVATYVGLPDLDYAKDDHSIAVIPKSKRSFTIRIIGKDENTTRKMILGYRDYALVQVRDAIGAKDMTIVNSGDGFTKIRLQGYENDGKPGLIKAEEIDVENWKTYLYRKTNPRHFLKQSLILSCGGMLLLSFALILYVMYDRKLRLPQDIIHCIEAEIFAVIDKKGNGVLYLTRRIQALAGSDRAGTSPVVLIPLKADPAMLRQCEGKIIKESLLFTDSAEQKSTFLRALTPTSRVLIGIGDEKVTDTELINLREVIESTGASVIGVVVFGVKTEKIRRSDEYFGKYFPDENC